MSKLAVVSGILICAAVASAQTKPALTGAWQVVEVTQPNGVVQDRKQPGAGGLLVSTERHFAFVDAGSAKERPALPDGGAAKAAAEDLRATWGPFNGWAGTYEWTGDGEVTSRYIVTKNPREMASGNAFVFAVKFLDANTMTLQLLRSQAGPVTNAPVFRMVRVK